MRESELCGKVDSRLQVNHKERGRIMACGDRWRRIYKEVQRIIEGTCSKSNGESTASLSCS